MHMLIVMALPILGIGLFFILPFWTAFPIYLCISLFAALVYYGMFKGMGGKALMGQKKMIGREVLVVDDINPEGKVEFEGEIWTATAEDKHFFKGERVKIRRFQGMTLVVGEAFSEKNESGITSEK